MTDCTQKHKNMEKTDLSKSSSNSSEAKKFPQVFAAASATFAIFGGGACLSWSSPAYPLMKNTEKIGIDLSDEQISWIASLVTLGAFVGAIPAGVIVNLFGRKRVLQLLSLPLFLSWILIAYSGCVHGLLLARFIAGIAIGIYCVAIPMYVGEIAEAKIRGTLGTFFQLQICAGLLFQYLIGICENWKLIALIPASVPIIFVSVFSFMPESPVYLSSRKMTNEARKSLQWLRGKDYNIDDELSKIQDQLREADKNKTNVLDLFRSKTLAKALIIAVGLMIFQQLSGINVVIFYTQSIFQDSGSTLPSYVPAIIVGSVMFLSTYLSTMLIDKAGRRLLLLISSTMMTVCLAILAVYFYLVTLHNIKLPFTVPLLSVAVYMMTFSLGFGPIPWIMLGELFSPQMKGAASAISVAFNWMLAFTVTKMFTNLVSCFGSGTAFALFAVVCLLGAAFVFFMVPETKGKDLEEIQRMLGGSQRQIHTECEYTTKDDTVVIDIKA